MYGRFVWWHDERSEYVKKEKKRTNYLLASNILVCINETSSVVESPFASRKIKKKKQ